MQIEKCKLLDSIPVLPLFLFTFFCCDYRLANHIAKLIAFVEEFGHSMFG